MFNKIAQSSRIRIFACISTLCLYMGGVFKNIFTYIHQGIGTNDLS
jgi:hypothetical protein